MRRRVFALGLGAMIPLAACASLLGLEDASLAPATTDADGASDVPVAEAGGLDASPPTGDCGAPLGTSDNCAACGHSCLGARCDDGGCGIIPILSGAVGPSSIALDDVAVYFATFDQIYRADKATNVAVDILAGQGGGGSIQSVVLDGPNAYWAARLSGASTGPKAGVGDAGRRRLGPGNTSPLAVAIAGERLLWNEYATATLQSVDKNDGSDQRQVTSATMRSASIAVDGDVAYLADSLASRILRVKLDGSSTTTLAITNGTAAGIALTADSVYFGSASGGLGVVAKTGGSASSFGTPQTRSVSDVATDGVSLYWADPGTLDGDGHRKADGCIWRCTLATCTSAPPVAVACGQFAPYRIAVDAHAIYWMNLGPGSPTDFSREASALKIAKPPP